MMTLVMVVVVMMLVMVGGDDDNDDFLKQFNVVACDFCIQMIIGTELKRYVMISNSSDESTDEFDRAVGHIIVSLAKVFPNVSPE